MWKGSFKLAVPFHVRSFYGDLIWYAEAAAQQLASSRTIEVIGKSMCTQ
ncbi:hypothetical protein [Mesorhizobium sp.]|nr:hypothetical protein [Mesorhizobium sp.]